MANSRERRKLRRAMGLSMLESNRSTVVVPNTKPSEPPAAMPPTWYQSTLLWGSASLAVTIILTVVAAMTKDLRWLLIIAWPFSWIAVWEFVTYFPRLKAKRTIITICAAIVFAASLYLLNLKLKPDTLGPGLMTTSQAPPQPSAQAELEAKTFINGLIIEYEKAHKGDDPTLDWVNTQLEKQQKPFRVTPPAGGQFVFKGGGFYNNGTAIENKNPNTRFYFDGTPFVGNKKAIKNLPPGAI